MLDDEKWDAMIGVGSPAAAALEQYAQQVGSTFITESYIEVADDDDDDDDFRIGDALVRDEGFHPFTHAAHKGYSGLNLTLEVPFANELDKAKFTWARNPSRSGYGIPLIKQGGNDTFYPDFLVWAYGDVYALDTKGSHIKADAMRKLVRIRQSPGRPRVHVRFVVEGRLDTSGAPVGKTGYTVIGFKPDGDVFFTQVEDLAGAAAVALKKSK
jgi:type III restriction enzyme